MLVVLNKQEISGQAEWFITSTSWRLDAHGVRVAGIICWQKNEYHVEFLWRIQLTFLEKQADIKKKLRFEFAEDLTCTVMAPLVVTVMCVPLNSTFRTRSNTGHCGKKTRRNEIKDLKSGVLLASCRGMVITLYFSCCMQSKLDLWQNQHSKLLNSIRGRVWKQEVRAYVGVLHRHDHARVMRWFGDDPHIVGPIVRKIDFVINRLRWS